MSYATVDDVKRLFRDFTDSPNAAVDDTDITLFLANTTAVIDGKLSQLYVLPLNETDNPQSFAILKQVQMLKVAGIVDDILNNYSEADKKPMWDMKAYKLMKQICPEVDPKTGFQPEPTMRLPDAQYLGTATTGNRIRVGPTTGAIFKKGEDNW